MKQLTMTLTLALATVASGFAQDPNPPHIPVIVKRIVLRNQTQDLGSVTSPIPFFTPAHDGFYRATLYIQAAGDPTVQCENTSQCTVINVVYAPNTHGTFNAGLGGSAVDAFPGTVGQSIGFFTFQNTAGTTPLAYDFIIVVEEL